MSEQRETTNPPDPELTENMHKIIGVTMLLPQKRYV